MTEINPSVVAATASIVYTLTTTMIVVAIITATVIADGIFNIWWRHKEDKALKKRLARDNLENLIYKLYDIEMKPSYKSSIRRAMIRHGYWLPPGSSK